MMINIIFVLCNLFIYVIIIINILFYSYSIYLFFLITQLI